jgi:hypothetical protein
MTAQVKNIKNILNEDNIQESFLRLSDIKDSLGVWQIERFCFNNFFNSYDTIIGHKKIVNGVVGLEESYFVHCLRNNKVIVIDELHLSCWNSNTISWIRTFLIDMVNNGYIEIEGEKVNVNLDNIYYIG